MIYFHIPLVRTMLYVKSSEHVSLILL